MSVALGYVIRAQNGPIVFGPVRTQEECLAKTCDGDGPVVSIERVPTNGERIRLFVWRAGAWQVLT